MTNPGRRVRRRLRALSPVGALGADLAVQVAAAALAAHPGATVDRVEVDVPGRYRVHLVSCSGDRVVVHVDGDRTVPGWLAPVR